MQEVHCGTVHGVDGSGFWAGVGAAEGQTLLAPMAAMGSADGTTSHDASAPAGVSQAMALPTPSHASLALVADCQR